jgi:hypothetical protein
VLPAIREVDINFPDEPQIPVIPRQDVVSFIAVGTCVIDADHPGNEETRIREAFQPGPPHPRLSRASP